MVPASTPDNAAPEIHVWMAPAYLTALPAKQDVERPAAYMAAIIQDRRAL